MPWGPDELEAPVAPCLYQIQLVHSHAEKSQCASEPDAKSTTAVGTGDIRLDSAWTRRRCRDDVDEDDVGSLNWIWVTSTRLFIAYKIGLI